MGWNKSFYTYKFKRSGYRYEVGLCIRSGNICWVEWAVRARELE
jgi:hypothetical protein